MSPRDGTARGGFSLIELLIVIAIIGIMASTAISFLLSARPHTQLEQAEIQLTATLHEARQLAISEEIGTRVILNVGTGEYSVERQNPDTLAWSLVRTRSLPELVTFVGANTTFPGSTVQFNTRGALIAGGQIQIATSAETRTLVGNLASGRFNFGGGHLR